MRGDKIGISSSNDAMLKDLSSGEPKKQIRAIRKAIQGLKKGLEISAQHEKTYLDDAASYLVSAIEYKKGKCHDGYMENFYLESKKHAEQYARYFADLQPPVRENVSFSYSTILSVSKFAHSAAFHYKPSFSPNTVGFLGKSLEKLDSSFAG